MPKFEGFPYKPYSIQVDFMNALYTSLNNGGVSMLESPTGTGKTLSIICSTLQWLIDRREKKESEERVEPDCDRARAGENGSDDEPDWMRNFVTKNDTRSPERKVKRNNFGIGTWKNNAGKKPGSLCNNPLSKDSEKGSCCKIGGEDVSNERAGSNEEDFLLEEYHSEDEGDSGNRKTNKRACGVSVCSSSDENEDGDCSNEEEEDTLKIFFCSRTHSQLSQFVKELRKTVYANEINAVCLGSRKNFCINEEVLKLGSANRINEQCSELQKKKHDKVSKIKNLAAEGRVRRAKASSGCPMLGKYKLQKQFRTEISQQGAMDIEDLVHLGRTLKTCPYYGSRSMVPGADLIVLPYQSLLSKSSRESLGLNLKNNVVIIDEAHNLADSLLDMYNSKITLAQLEDVKHHIEKYFERFRNLLGPGNRRYIQTLMVFCRAFLQALCIEQNVSCTDPFRDSGKTSRASSASNSTMAINDFLFSLNIDNINLIKLLQYVKESNIMHKVSGYGDRLSSLQKASTPKGNSEYSDEGSTLSSFRALVDMLKSLTNKDGDGRVIISRSREQQGVYLKYVMLTGTNIFSEIVGEAHAVILAGGTLQPIEETRERLFPWLSPSQLSFFSCSHIVSPESIFPVSVSRGPSGHPFDFSYNSRSSTEMVCEFLVDRIISFFISYIVQADSRDFHRLINLVLQIQELGRLICNLTTVIPEGIIVFFSSFDYEEQVYNAWKESGIVERITKKKRIFREPRKNTDVEAVLREYKETIDMLSAGNLKENPAITGATLLAIVGGKISEGINLSDGMGRCVVMVGLPYPSPSDIELMERVKFIEGLGHPLSTKTSHLSLHDEISGGDAKSGIDILRSCKHRGRDYYENLCMKAVNQSIGRAIRHVNDYAAILLVDSRYANTSDPSKRSFSHPTTKLPQWIKARLASTDNYGELHRMLHQFFKYNKTRGF